jgi:hypothetical protein
LESGIGHYYSREGAVVAGGNGDGGEVVVLEAHHAQLAADASPKVEGAIERVAIEDPAKRGIVRFATTLEDHQFHQILVK